jgi:cephalosporin hydroxylase
MSNNLMTLRQYSAILRQLAATWMRRLVSRGAKQIKRNAGRDYLLWYYYSQAWKQTSWLGVETQKLPTDMWSYQEILTQLRPRLVIEFGSWMGGSALFFSGVLQQLGSNYKIFSVDVNHERLHERARKDPNIIFFRSSSSNPEVAQRISELRVAFPGPVFAILDSDHSMTHVLAELILLRELLVRGDYVIVEDSNISGHPVISPDWGLGPYEAIQEYMRRYPEDYEFDRTTENKFAGVTFAPSGFLIRR